jgi:hypothetical protein
MTTVASTARARARALLKRRPGILFNVCVNSAMCILHNSEQGGKRMIKKNGGVWYLVLVLGVIFCGALSVSADQGRRALLDSLNLTAEQVSALKTMFDEHNAKQYETITELENKVLTRVQKQKLLHLLLM